MVIEIIGRGQGHHTKEKLTHFFSKKHEGTQLKMESNDAGRSRVKALISSHYQGSGVL